MSLSQGCLSSKVFVTYYTIIILVMTLRIGVSESISLILDLFRFCVKIGEIEDNALSDIEPRDILLC